MENQSQDQSKKGESRRPKKKFKQEGGYERPVRSLQRVDFQKIENAPLGDFEKKVQEKIAVSPDALDCLIQEESEQIFREALKQVSLSRYEMLCVALAFEGLIQAEIASRLGIQDALALYYLRTAVQKIRHFIESKYGPAT